MCGCSSTVGVVRLRLRSVNANQRMQCCCWSTSSVITTSKQRTVDFVFVRFACRSYAAIYAGSSVAPVQRCLLAPSACSRAALICCQSANVLSIFVQLFVCSSTLVARQRTHDGRNAIVDWRLLATTWPMTTVFSGCSHSLSLSPLDAFDCLPIIHLRIYWPCIVSLYLAINLIFKFWSSAEVCGQYWLKVNMCVSARCVGGRLRLFEDSHFHTRWLRQQFH